MPWVRVLTWWRPNVYKTAKLNMNFKAAVKATAEVSYQVNRKDPPRSSNVWNSLSVT